MKNRRIAVGLLVAIVLSISAVQVQAAASGAASAKNVRIGMVVAYTSHDHSFNQNAVEGLKQAHHQLGVTTSIQIAQQSSDFKSSLQFYAQQGYDLVIANGILFANALYHVATAYPTVHFAIVDGTPLNDENKPVNLSNVAELFFSPEQSGYLVGLVAGGVEKSGKGPATHNTIGVLGGLNIPFINAMMCGYYEGAKKVDPSVKLAWGYSNTFTDPTVGQSDGQNQISAGADILFQVASGAGLGYLKAAKDAHKYGIGFVSDQSHLGRFMLTSALVKVNVATFRTIRSVVRGHFKGGAHLYSMANGGGGYSLHLNHVPKKVQKRAAKAAARITAGKLKINASCTLPTSA